MCTMLAVVVAALLMALAIVGSFGVLCGRGAMDMFSIHGNRWGWRNEIAGRDLMFSGLVESALPHPESDQFENSSDKHPGKNTDGHYEHAAAGDHFGNEADEVPDEDPNPHAGPGILWLRRPARARPL